MGFWEVAHRRSQALAQPIRVITQISHKKTASNLLCTEERPQPSPDNRRGLFFLLLITKADSAL